MPPQLLIFAGDGAAAAAGAACELLPAGTARPLPITPPARSPLRAAADRLAESLDLRPVAAELAVLEAIREELAEQPDAAIVLDAAAPAPLLRLLATADLARARIAAGRPPAGTSTLAAQRAGEHPDLPVLRAAALAGDLLRAPELTAAALLGAADTPEARAALALAGLAVATGPAPANPAAAARALLAAREQRDVTAPAAPLVHPMPDGAELRLALPGRPDDLRAVRSGGELVLSAAGAEARLQAPAALGALVPGAVAAGDDGTLVATFTPAPAPEDA